VIICENKYGKYCLPAVSGDNIAPELHRRGKQHEPATVRFIMDNSSGGDVVHAGAYFGDFLPALSSGVDEGRKVIAFEPCLEHYKCAKKTLELNNIKNVELHNAALGQCSGEARLRTQIKGVHEGGRSKIADDGDEVVKVVAIDDIIGSTRVSVIHLDVEHYEKQALMGAIETIKKYLPLFIVEDIGKHPLNIDGGAWLSEQFSPMGYRPYAATNHNVSYKVF